MMLCQNLYIFVIFWQNFYIFLNLSTKFMCFSHVFHDFWFWIQFWDLLIKFAFFSWTFNKNQFFFPFWSLKAQLASILQSFDCFCDFFFCIFQKMLKKIVFFFLQLFNKIGNFFLWQKKKKQYFSENICERQNFSVMLS